MGELPFSVPAALHPDHLWIWRKSVYVDENQRTWLPISIKVQPLWGRAGQGRAAWVSPSLDSPWVPKTPQAVHGFQEPLGCGGKEAQAACSAWGGQRGAQMKPV